MKNNFLKYIATAIVVPSFLVVSGCPNDKGEDATASSVSNTTSKETTSPVAEQQAEKSPTTAATNEPQPNNQVEPSASNQNSAAQNPSDAATAPIGSHAKSAENSISTKAAANYCAENGGKIEVLQHKLNEQGNNISVCVFNDNSRCEQWLFFNNQCKKGDCKDTAGNCKAQTQGARSPATINCKNRGGKIEKITNRYGKSNICVFDDKSRCEQWKLYRNQCKKGDCKDEAGMCKTPLPGAATAIQDPAGESCWKAQGHIRRVGDEGKYYQVCVFKDGSRCEKKRLLKKQCKKGDCTDAAGLCKTPQ